MGSDPRSSGTSSNQYGLLKFIIHLTVLGGIFFLLIFFVIKTTMNQQNKKTINPTISPSVSSPDKLLKVHLTVFNTENELLDNVKVQFILDDAPPKSTFTNSSGYARMEITNRKDIDILLIKEGFKTIKETIDLERKQNRERQFVLERKPYLDNLSSVEGSRTFSPCLPSDELSEVKLIVLNEENEPIKGVRVQFIFDGAPVSELTDSKGYVRMEIPIIEYVNVLLTKNGFKTSLETINLKAKINETINVVLQCDCNT
ncbi:MAG: hypothetical protein F6K14_27905 [Symploca sp. SIO2C1]|nr:hypothetical protein [Symploca sp. SIO2C1]